MLFAYKGSTNLHESYVTVQMPTKNDQRCAEWRNFISFTQYRLT